MVALVDSAIRHSFLQGLMLLLAVNSAYSQTVDAAQKVSEALTAYGPVPVTVITRVPRQVDKCRMMSHGGSDYCYTETVYDQRPSTTNQILTASNIRITKSGELQFGPAVRTELPDKVIVQDGSIQNCTKNQATQTITLQDSFQRSASMAFSESVTHALSQQINFGLKLSSVFSVGGQVQITDSATNGTVSTTGSQDTVTRIQTGTITTPAHTNTMAELRIWPVQYSVPFQTTVTVDADLSTNDHGFHLLSQVLSESQRTFSVAGVIQANDASEGKLVFYDLDYDPSSCHGITGVLATSKFIPKADQKLREKSLVMPLP